MIRAYTVKESFGRDLGECLDTQLNIIQKEWGCKVISVTDIKIAKSPCESNEKAFVIIYESEED